VQTSYPDGSFTAVQHGAAFVGLPVAITAQFGLPAVFVSAGKLTISIDANGNFSVSLQGHVLGEHLRGAELRELRFLVLLAGAVIHRQQVAPVRGTVRRPGRAGRIEGR
jgi:hypothetical protein